MKGYEKIRTMFIASLTAASMLVAVVPANAEPGSDGPGGSAPGGAPSGGGSSTVSYNAATEISTDVTATAATYTSTTAEENALLVTGGTSTLTDITVTKSGSPSGSSDNYDFYGTNAAVCVTDGTLNITGNSTITTDGSYANGVYAHGDGVINISNAKITTSRNNSGGVMVTGGGILTANDVTVTTSGGSSASIRSDRGGGTLTVNGGSFTTAGQGSPAIYSTADITVKDAQLISEHSEGIVVEGSNSVTLEGVTLTDTNDTLNGQSETYKNIFLYQSQSGDASDGTGYFTAKDSTITTNKGDNFFVTNNTAVITLENNTITNNDVTGYFLRAMTGAWGTSGSNGGDVTLTAKKQDLDGDIYIDSVSSLAMSLSDGSNFSGTITGNGTSTDVSVTLDSTSTWTLTGDSYIKSISDSTVTNYSNINLNGYTLYVNGTAITSTDYDSETPEVTEEPAYEGYAVIINSINTDNGNITADITIRQSGSYTAYLAVYDGGVLEAVSVAETVSETVDFGSVSYNAETDTLKCFVWDGMTPVSEVYTIEAANPAPTEAPMDTPTVTDTPTETETPTVTDTPAETETPTVTDTPAETETPTVTDTPTATETPVSAYTATFVKDSGVASIDVYYTQDYTTASETDASMAIARSSSTGEADTSGDGQINFIVNLKDGYTIASVTATEGKYKNIKAVSDTCYRITKVTGDMTIMVTTASSQTDPTETTSPEATETPQVTGSGTIHLIGTYIDISEVQAGVTLDESATVATINAKGTYTVDGSLSEGQIVVDYTPASTADTVTLNLNGASITSSSANTINVTSGYLTVASVSGTESTVTATGGSMTAIYSADNLEIKGEGTLNVISSSGNGIRGKETVEIGAGTLNVTAGNNGIKGDEEVKLTKKCGTVTINSTGDGIKSDNAPTVKKPSRTGVVTINGGTVNITTGTETDAETGEVSNGDGIQADTLLVIANSPVITINAKGEAIKANFSHLDLESTEGYSDVAETLALGDGCVVISGGTITTITGEDGIKAAKDVTISGGDVTITQAGDDGIQAGDIVINETTPKNSERIDGSVAISGGTVEIKNAAGDGIVSDYYYSQSDGTVTVNAAKDGIQAGKAYTYYDIHGSGDDETVLYETNGIVNITGGTLNITAAGGATRTIKDSDGNTTLSDIDYSCKGIKARRLIDISGGTIDVNSLDDAVHSNHTARISGGDITVKSCDDGVHGEYYLYISDDAKIDVRKSYEGIEGSKIYISGGETYVVSTDDGANAAGDEPTDSAITLTSTVSLASADEADIELMAGPGGQGGPGGWSGGPGQNDDTASYGYLEVSGGLLYIEAEGDGFDTNGSGLISGGTVLVNGPTSGGNGVFDKGDSSSDTLVITGGTVIGAGTSDMAVTPNSATGSQAYVVTTLSQNQTAGKGIQVTNGSSEIITYIPSKAYKWILVSTPSMSSGTSYTVKYGGTVSDGTWTVSYNDTYGIKTGATFSGGSSTNVTSATGSSSSGGGR